MKVAVVSESPADEAAMRVLVARIIDGPIQWVEVPVRPGGWPSVRQSLAKILMHLHYGTERPDLTLEKERMVSAAERLADNLATLEGFFHSGFVPLARALRAW